MLHWPSKLLATCLLGGTALGGQGPNLVQNGDFESGTSGWLALATNAGTAAFVESGTSFTGASSARIEIAATGARVAAGWLQPVALRPGGHYLFSYAVRTQVADLVAFPLLTFVDGAGANVHSMSLFPASGSRPFERFETRFTVPPGATGLNLFLLLFGTSGTAWFDTVTLTELTDPSPSIFTVDIGAASTGPLRPFTSTNVGPIHPGHPGHPGTPSDLTSGFRRLGINFVRTHDFYGPCDMHVLFPDFNADPLDPASYDFASSDQVIADTIASGAKVLFRLGESFEANPIHNQPPADFTKWATICLQIVKHYNAGWNQGFFYGIRDWEIWNEPDITAFWTGTAAQYASLYCTTASMLHGFDPTLRIGGPAVASIASETFLDTFLSQVAASGAPLDFFSYHLYSSANPRFFSLVEGRAREILTRHGFGSVPTFLTEWNSYVYDPENSLSFGRDDALDAALTASALIYAQDSGLARAFRYRTDEFLFGLFHDNGTLSASGHAFRMLASLRRTPDRIPTTGGDALGTTLLAGRSKDRNEIRLLICDPRSTALGYRLHVQGIARGQRYAVEVRRIDDVGHADEAITRGIVDVRHPDLDLTPLPPFVDLVTLRLARATKKP